MEIPKDPSAFPASLEEEAIQWLRKGKISLYCASANILSEEEEVLTRYQPEELQKVLKKAKKGIVFWAARTKEAVLKLLENDRGTISKDIQELAPEVIQEFFENLAPELRVQVLNTLLELCFNGSSAQTIHTQSFPENENRTKKELDNTKIERAFEIELDPSAFETVQSQSEKVLKALFLRETGKNEQLDEEQRTLTKNETHDYKPWLMLCTGEKIRVLCFIGNFTYLQIVQAFKGDKSKAHEYLDQFVLSEFSKRSVFTNEDKVLTA